MARSRPVLETADPEDHLGGNAFIEVDDRAVRALAGELRQRAGGDVAFAKAAFEWVRDQVAHSYDVHDPRVTLTAGEVLEHRVGLCFDTQFSLDPERLAWQVDRSLGEVDYPQILPSPARCVVGTLSAATDVLALYDGCPPSFEWRHFVTAC